VVSELVGIVCGHVFYFFMEVRSKFLFLKTISLGFIRILCTTKVLPKTHGKDFLRPMPKFLDDIFSSGAPLLLFTAHSIYFMPRTSVFYDFFVTGEFTTSRAQSGGNVRGARPQGARLFQNLGNPGTLFNY
jgi:hypothetical protein